MFLAGACGAEEELIQVRGLVHLNTSVSSGDYSPEELVKTAKEAGINAVFLTEDFKPKVEYGVFPFRNVVKKTVEYDGLLGYGTGLYRQRVENLNREYPDVTVFMAAEVAPFYYWTGSPFQGDLTLNDWDIQFIVTGMDPRGYRDIPAISSGSFSRYGLKSILMLWPLILIAIGAISLKKKHPRFYVTDTLCWTLIVAGILFVLHYFPFREVEYDQYHGPQGVGPYQTVIDYVNEKGGMTFWASPDVETEKKIGSITYKSTSAVECMLEARDYTGFCCFYEGYRAVGRPGGVWDKVLNAYCAGKRESPMWAIGEMSYHGKDPAGRKFINEVQTVFLVPENTKKNILRAMWNGNMYAVRRTREYALQLDFFTVKYSNGGKSGAGETVDASGPVTVSFAVSWEGRTEDPVTARVIRSGRVIKEFKIEAPGTFEFEDDLYEPGSMVYYRLDIRGKYPNMLFSNPVFVRFK